MAASKSLLPKRHISKIRLKCSGYSAMKRLILGENSNNIREDDRL